MAATSCDMDLLSGQVGDPGSATVRNLPPGGEVRLLFGGIEVGSATAPLAAQSAGAPVRFNGPALPAQAGTSTVRIDFVVPQVAPGVYLVTAVGVGFAVSCHAGLDGFEVLAGNITRPDSGGLGTLPRTGIFIALLLALALVLLLVGRALVEASHERRRAEDRVAAAAVSARARDAERRGLVPK